MGISGNLKTMVLAELLQWLSMGQKRGTLVIESQKVTKRIFFDGGIIISSASTDPKEYLGRFLASHGFIPEDTINEALSNQENERQLLGKILVNMGAISEEDLHQMLRLKAEESIYDIFTWEEGDFEFLDDELPAETMIRMHLDVQGIVLEGTRRVDEWHRIRQTIPSNLCIPVSVVEGFDDLEIDDFDRQLLAWINDDRTVEEISQQAQISLFAVAGIIAEQVQAKTVKVVKPRIIEVEVEVEVEVPASPAEDGATGPLPQVVQAPPQQQQQAPQGYGMPMYQQQPMQGYAPPPSTPPMQLNDGRTLHFAAPPGGMSTPPGGMAMPQGMPGMPPQAAGPPPPSTEAETLLQQADTALEKKDLDEALEKFRKAKSAQGSSAAVEAQSDVGEQKVRQALEQDGLELSAVPKLKCGMDELTKLDISPQEGFMLTRVDGSFDIKSILKMSPMPAIDAQILFWKLKRSGHVGV